MAVLRLDMIQRAFFQTQSITLTGESLFVFKATLSNDSLSNRWTHASRTQLLNIVSVAEKKVLTTTKPVTFPHCVNLR